MPDLRRRLAELDLLEPPDMVADIDRRVAERQFAVPDSLVRAPGAGWRGPLIAVGTAVAILVVVVGSLLLFGGDEADVVDEPIPTTLMPPVTTVPVTEATSPVVGAWNPILSATVAREAPAAATCPQGTNPDVPGPVYQTRSGNEGVGLVSAVFDQRAGRVVYVDHPGETWTLDVCTNTWYQMHPIGSAPEELFGGLVYDIDSDVTVALGPESVYVYDANANTWTQPANDGLGFGTDLITPSGGAYDPVTGLIITSNLRWTSETSPTYWEFWAYDVDTNEWTPLGPLRLEPSHKDQLDFLGYSEQLDRLIVTGGVDGEVGTILVDPRTGDVTVLPVESPVVDFGWPMGTYGAAGGTIYATANTMDTSHDVCGFDANVKSWTACFDIPKHPYVNFPYPALVGDPINNRLVVINPRASAWATNSRVGAIDLDTGDWTQLLAPAKP
jgi:hypothetical protein